jgi:hypothetical protein
MSARRRASGSAESRSSGSRSSASRSSDPVEVLSRWRKNIDGDEEAREAVRAASGWCKSSFRPGKESDCVEADSDLRQFGAFAARLAGLANS